MNTKKLVFVLPLLLTLILQAFSPAPAYAGGSVGTGTPGSCDEAALEAALAVGGQVTFNCGGAATILLTGTKVIATDTQINGAGLITLDGGNSVRLFIVNAPAVLNLSGLTLTRGFIDQENGGAILINKDAEVNIRNSTLSNNKAMSGYGGAIYVGEGKLNIFDSTFSNNNADVESLGNLSLGGGAIQNNDGTINISGSTFKGNSVTSHTADGGAIYNGDYDATPIGTNTEGGGIPDDKLDILNITNSTFYGNYLQNNSGLPASGSAAGAIRSSSRLTITHSTFSNNDSGTPMADGAAGAVTVTDGYATYTNNIFANSSGADCAVRLGILGQTSVGNLIEDNAPLYGWGCGQDVITGIDPVLGSLQDNGGPTQTMSLEIGSPAIDAAGSCAAASDQRSLNRPQPVGGSCDLGAYEFDNTPPAITNVTSTNADGIYGIDSVINITITFNENVTVNGIPQLTLETGTPDRKAGYTGGGPNTLNFAYTVQDGDMSDDLDYTSTAALDFGGGSIKDLALNNADLTLPAPGALGSLSANKGIRIDTSGPILLSFTLHDPVTQHTNADMLVFRAHFSGTVTAVDTADFAVSGGTTATVTNVSAVDSGTYDITVSGGNLASFIGTVGLNLSSNQNITDPNGAPLPQAEPAIDETYTVDNSSPTVVSILRADPSPTTAAVLHFTVTFSKPVSNVGMNDFVLYKAGTNKVAIIDVSGAGATYTVSVDSGTKYGIIRLDVPVTATVQDEMGNPLSGLPYKSGQSYTINKPLTFVDVPSTHLYWEDIEILYANGLTGGCATSPLKFCPDQIMNRGQAATFNLRANFGSSYVPPTPIHYFKDDWKKGPWAETWAEGMWNTGLSSGCSTNPLKYCPWDQIPREQAVIFALRIKYGSSYTPPPATGTLFADMTNPSYYATPWAEQAYKDGLIPNCGTSGGKPKICPKALVSRGQAAYMIVRAKGLTMP